ncbi:hypothetical protein L6452_40789 [Arctium lappa]|uniref:Uncharacterized protein n=1 Tax=Arctium lappa TaxID=4217 RepID=A0ACB8XNF8_ARCLA|nr:hypothetical protein L6452_40789 [Arctium lappa]
MPPQSWSSMPIEADAYPSYSTQQGLNHFDLNTDGLDLDADISESDKSQKADRATWSVEEDKVLAMAYVTISTDPIVGNDQKNATFWQRVITYYNDHRPARSLERILSSVKGHFYKMSPQVIKGKTCEDLSKAFGMLRRITKDKDKA